MQVINIFLVGLAFVFCGCALDFGKFGRVDFVDFGVFSQRAFSLEERGKISVLYVSSQMKNLQESKQESKKQQKSQDKKEKIVYYFAIFDSLGVPLLSRKLENGTFSNVKFLPPSRGYDKLFLQVLESIKSSDSIAFTYKDIKVKELDTQALDTQEREARDFEYTNE